MNQPRRKARRNPLRLLCCWLLLLAIDPSLGAAQNSSGRPRASSGKSTPAASPADSAKVKLESGYRIQAKRALLAVDKLDSNFLSSSKSEFDERALFAERLIDDVGAMAKTRDETLIFERLRLDHFLLKAQRDQLEMTLRLSGFEAYEEEQKKLEAKRPNNRRHEDKCMADIRKLLDSGQFEKEKLCPEATLKGNAENQR